ncbi:MAG: SHOCT domain-containing protein [Caldilineales bacterium]|nr:SHOCT domain-containing protein [Caldilineales bacterium]
MMAFGMGGFGILFMILIWGGLIVLVVWGLSALVPRISSGNGSTHPPIADASPPALDLLKQRYARGEITKSEYDSMRQDILA